MNRLHWFLARRFDELPILSLMAWLSVLILIVVLIWLVVETQSQPEQMTAIETDETVTIISSDKSPDAELLAGAPKLAQVTHAIDTLYRVSSQHQLNLQEVLYQDQLVPGEPLVIYSIDFDVEQTYPQIKAFLSELLATLPYLALDQVSFEREDIKDTVIKSHFRFKLFLDREHE